MIRRAIMVFVPAAVIALGVIYLVFRAQEDANRSIAAAAQREIIHIGAQRFTASLTTIAGDTRFLAEQQVLQRLLTEDTPEARRALALDYASLAEHRKIFDQIRFIDLSGREIVRVNWNGETSAIVPQEELQNQSGQYYVRDTLELGPGEVYVSRLDLNVERGSIEQPLKPVIRFGAPVFDSQGRRKGLVVLNYLAQRVLDRVRALAPHGQEHIWLVDQRGYWLLGPDPMDEWAFMYPDRQDRSFARRYPTVWNTLRDARRPGQVEIAGGLLTYTPLSLAAADPAEAALSLREQPSWTLLSYLPTARLAQQSTALATGLLPATIVLLGLLGAITWFVARHWTARQQSEEQLQRSEARFRGLLESAPDAVLITDAEGRIVLANAQAESLFGYHRQDLIGKPVEMLMPEQYQAHHVGHRDSYVANPSARPMGLGLKLQARRHDGSEFPVAISLSPSRGEEGMLVFCDIRDITEQRAAEQQIEDMNERLVRDNAELESLNKELEAFSYSVSHDLRAPLRAIDGFSQALLEDCADKLDSHGRDYLGRVRNAAQRMGHLIDDLLKLARVTRTEVKLDDVDMGALAQDIVQALRSSEPERKAEIRIADRLMARADGRLLRIALENLIGNAWKFTAGKDPARIELGAVRQNGEAAYFVRDNGVGFDMAYAGRLFGAFQRLHHEAEFSGTGIGLATVQRIVRRHGGRIWVEAEAGKGATFYFTI